MSQAEKLIELIVKNGLTTYKTKNSRHKYIQETPVVTDKQGVVFGFRTKEHMTESRGFVMSSLESVLENQEKLSHWTPNIFSYGGYNKQSVYGHSEDNLIRLNCFVLDVDTNNPNFLNDLMMASIDTDELLPTAILKTPKGYHVYYVLEEAMFVSSANNYKSLNVAKLISSNLRRSFAEQLPGIDVTCNHFGIFRMPTKQNLIHFEPNFVYSFKQLMNWSMKYQDKISFEFTLDLKKKAKTVRQVDESWYRELMNTAKIRGNKGEIGRNNTIFTCSLACYSSGLSFEECYDEMDQFNSELKDFNGHSASLKDSEVVKIIKSAYSGKYTGASKEFIQELLSLYTGSTYNPSVRQNGRVAREKWVKHAKPREEREKSHYKEWAEDLINYINEKTSSARPYIQTDRETICQALNMPESTYKDLMRQLKKEKRVYVESKRGRNGYTKLATKKSMAVTLKNKKQYLFNHYMDVLKRYFEDSPMLVRFAKNIEFKEPKARSEVLLFDGVT
ncbi:primase C-terminal domain-containing protein [Vagococcus carniphilus]|uniref:Primase C-terminal 1 domain-containing protein n=1 Tax=Vagococcus carniphilus TaxID=218144 RepID=A0A430AQJ0_9ENTE|nr:primase C-terminal domain-containing protein [Vagococcus carniphilus]QNN74578.1 primase C-terminal domain-containing protein [Vagococcus carniphilus]RSU10388.1 hypothetical protein CBF28_13805 [Vagococcus carniphilus]